MKNDFNMNLNQKEARLKSSSLVVNNINDPTAECDASSVHSLDSHETIPYLDGEEGDDDITLLENENWKPYFDQKKIKLLDARKVTSAGALVVVRLQVFGWWFGKVIRAQKPSRNHVSIEWFGDHTVMEVPTDCIEDYRTFTEIVSMAKMKKKSYKKAVEEFLHEIFLAYNGKDEDLFKLSNKINQSIFNILLTWGRNDFEEIEGLSQATLGSTNLFEKTTSQKLKEENQEARQLEVSKAESFTELIPEEKIDHLKNNNNKISTDFTKIEKKSILKDIDSEYLSSSSTSTFSDSTSTTTAELADISDVSFTPNANQTKSHQKHTKHTLNAYHTKTQDKHLVKDGIKLDYSLIGTPSRKRKCFVDASDKFSAKKSPQRSSEQNLVRSSKRIPDRSSDSGVAREKLSKESKVDEKVDSINDDLIIIKAALRKADGKDYDSDIIDNLVFTKEDPGVVSKKAEKLQKSNTTKKLRKSNTTEKLQQSSTAENVRKSSSGSSQENIDAGKHKYFKNGDIVIGKLKGFDWWFGKVTSHQKAKQKEAVYGCLWVRWFGDHKHSQLPYEYIEDLSTFPNRIMLNKLKGTYMKATTEMLEEVSSRCNKQLEHSKEDTEQRLKELIKWGMSRFQPEGVENINNHPEEEVTTTDDSTEEESLLTQQNKLYPDLCDEVKSLFNEVFEGKRDIEKLCLSCGDTKVVTKHPLFEGGLCKECKETFMEGVYLYDDEDFQMYCCICNDGQQIISCDKTGCKRSYCSVCLDMFCGDGYMAKISHEDSWECFLCTGQMVRILKRRVNWQECLNELFKNDMDCLDYGPTIFYNPIPYKERKPIRVLALFDGIATGYYVLNELDFEIEVYLAAEIDEHAITVSKVRHGNKIHHIGDVRSLREKDIQELGPFDLVIGGSPCNDLSIANPARKGIYDGTGALFFEYFRILNYARPSPPDSRPFFWFFENVVGMRYHDREVISRFLECHPFVISAKDVSAQYRTRYFWGNLPGMSRSLAPLPNDKLTLQECLEPDCGRKAKFDKVRCITTMSHSLKQTKHLLLPVTMEKKDDSLWVTEIERIFGFPTHYTDVANMGRTHRQKLLGKSWCVPVVRHLLAPLRDYFRTKNHEDNE